MLDLAALISLLRLHRGRRGRTRMSSGSSRAFGGSIRGECTDRILSMGEADLLKTVREYVEHHNNDRPHQSLEGSASRPRAVEDVGEVAATPVLGGQARLLARLRPPLMGPTRALLTQRIADANEAAKKPAQPAADDESEGEAQLTHGSGAEGGADRAASERAECNPEGSNHRIEDSRRKQECA
ncbi:MAG: hypothetical protein ACJAQ3_003395 [Planctomycetota bacterium]|jgi:hypothetical protein